MPPIKREKEQVLETDDLHQKKKGKPSEKPNYIAIHLDEKTRSALNLVNEEILFIQNLSYLSKIADQLFYIYDIVARVCYCPPEAVKLYRQSDGEFREENDGGWSVVGPNEELKSGDYLCKCKEGQILSSGHSDSLRALQKPRA